MHMNDKRIIHKFQIPHVLSFHLNIPKTKCQVFLLLNLPSKATCSDSPYLTQWGVIAPFCGPFVEKHTLKCSL